MSDEVRIGIAGVGGRMGRMLVKAAGETAGCCVTAGSCLAGDPVAGQDIGSFAGVPPLGIQPTEDAAALFAASDVVLDFTAPAATLRHAEVAAAQGKALMTGTTGLTAEQRGQVAAAAAKAPLLIASNTSQGVNLLLSLVERVAAALDESYDIEVLEMHHRMKVDAPSGTALSLGHAAAAGRGKPLEEIWVKSRDGQTGARPPGTIGFATLRGGDVTGEHSVIFAGPGERIEITHKAHSREVFAFGAVRAALWLAGRQPGLYDMSDVLGLSKDKSI